MSLLYEHLWIAGGKTTGSFGRTWSINGAYHLHKGKWTSFNKNTTSLIDEKVFRDVIAVANDYNQPDRAFIGSYGEGLMEIIGDSAVKVYDDTNMDEHSLNLGDFGGSDEFVGVAGLVFDLKGNLWVVNPLNTRPLSVMTPDKEWMNFSFGNEVSGSLKFSDIIVQLNYGVSPSLHVL